MQRFYLCLHHSRNITGSSLSPLLESEVSELLSSQTFSSETVRDGFPSHGYSARLPSSVSVSSTISGSRFSPSGAVLDTESWHHGWLATPCAWRFLTPSLRGRRLLPMLSFSYDRCDRFGFLSRRRSSRRAFRTLRIDISVSPVICSLCIFAAWIPHISVSSHLSISGRRRRGIGRPLRGPNTPSP